MIEYATILLDATIIFGSQDIVHGIAINSNAGAGAAAAAVASGCRKPQGAVHH